MKTYALILTLLLTLSVHAQSIAEKKASLGKQGSDLNTDLKQVLEDANLGLKDKRQQLHDLYQRVNELHQSASSEESYQDLLEKIRKLKVEIRQLQEEWRQAAREGVQTEGYALWHQPETTVGQLVIDYGSQDYVYLFTPDIGQTRMGIASNLPIPDASWDEMLALILRENGIGIKQLNPYLRQLYKIQDNKSGIQLITNKRADLALLPVTAKVCYMLSPEPTDARKAWALLERFSNPNSTALQMVGRDIFVVTSIEELNELLKLYDFVSLNRGDKDYKIISLYRVDAEEVARILSAVFDQPAVTIAGDGKTTKGSRKNNASEVSGLQVITLANVSQAVFIVGTQEEIRKAEEIIREVDSSAGDARERVIYWYTAKHSGPEELANVLSRIYALMIKQGANKQLSDDEVNSAIAEASCDLPCDTGCGYDCDPGTECSYYLNHTSPQRARLQDSKAGDPNKGRNNFIVDLKTGAIVMVVEAPLLPQMKELIRKLDVPKKMVRLEVLLFEKRVRRQNDFGLNLLRIGDRASQTHSSSVTFTDVPETTGIFQYLLSRKKACSGFPAFDLIYKFMMAQDDITINATPSVVTMNQTPARIAIEDEISVSTGVLQINTEGGVTNKDSFARGSYGIKIDIVPTIHLGESASAFEKAYVTLDTDVIFETIQRGNNPTRPDVTRRTINNHVRIPDGQTVILGGLRRKITEDGKESIPFLGELPGFGKLFSSTQMLDSSTEMYIFITPTIINSPSEDLERIRNQELCRRPGDIPSFLKCLNQAREREREEMMSQTMDMLFGREAERIEYKCGEYDGRSCR